MNYGSSIGNLKNEERTILHTDHAVETSLSKLDLIN